VPFGSPKPREEELTGRGPISKSHALGRGKPASASLDFLTRRMLLSYGAVSINPDS